MGLHYFLLWSLTCEPYLLLPEEYPLIISHCHFCARGLRTPLIVGGLDLISRQLYYLWYCSLEDDCSLKCWSWRVTWNLTNMTMLYINTAVAYLGFHELSKTIWTQYRATQPPFKHFFAPKLFGKLKIAQFMEFSLDLIVSHIPIP